MVLLKSHELSTWQEARTRFTNQLQSIVQSDLKKQLPGTLNSVGFLIKHIADVELLFAKNVFKNEAVKVTTKTVINKQDTGEWTDLPELLTYVAYAQNMLQRAIESIDADDWSTIITTQEFGSKTKAQALGRIISHTAYHAGQLALVVKYGSK